MCRLLRAGDVGGAGGPRLPNPTSNHPGGEGRIGTSGARAAHNLKDLQAASGRQTPADMTVAREERVTPISCFVRTKRPCGIG